MAYPIEHDTNHRAQAIRLFEQSEPHWNHVLRLDRWWSEQRILLRPENFGPRFTRWLYRANGL